MNPAINEGTKIRSLSNRKNRTNFKGRIGIKNDADEIKENFKNFFRKFKLYQFLKNIEKKYIRSGKNK